MTATERLRALLDERGVEWGNVRNDGSESDFLTEWQFDGIEGHAIATEWAVGRDLSVCIGHPMTPEQAVEATLGRGTCHVRNDEDTCWYDVCSACGFVWPDDYSVNYCPNCGRKVVE